MLALGLASVAVPVAADVPWWRLDRIENRWDLRESVYDQRRDYGRVDVVEDYFDRVEGRADRRDMAVYRRFDGHERRTVRFKLFGN